MLAFTLAVGLADIGGSVFWKAQVTCRNLIGLCFMRWVNHPEQIALAKFRTANFWEGERSAIC